MNSLHSRIVLILLVFMSITSLCHAVFPEPPKIENSNLDVWDVDSAPQEIKNARFGPYYTPLCGYYIRTSDSWSYEYAVGDPDHQPFVSSFLVMHHKESNSYEIIGDSYTVDFYETHKVEELRDPLNQHYGTRVTHTDTIVSLVTLHEQGTYAFKSGIILTIGDVYHYSSARQVYEDLQYDSTLVITVSGEDIVNPDSADVSFVVKNSEW